MTAKIPKATTGRRSFWCWLRHLFADPILVHCALCGNVLNGQRLKCCRSVVTCHGQYTFDDGKPRCLTLMSVWS